ncbi:uncharacterized protein LOC127239547 [Andrographis paniculata]|uniref:uncharacterized protein LOC127239547 n=1 Tax=Andrographis paniculata TaxID=175694 RepID=UPI0021E81DD6|nr:uncharacterized protein LOC127239547 [Andrographis paniculata]
MECCGRWCRCSRGRIPTHCCRKKFSEEQKATRQTSSLLRFQSMKDYKAGSAQEAWNILQTTYSEQDQVKKLRLQSLRAEFENMEMKDNEKIGDYFTRANSLVNQMASNGEVETQRIVEKILLSLQSKFDHVVVAIEESQDLSSMALESLQGRLEAHEVRILQRNSQSSTSQDHALKSQFTGGHGFFRGHGRARNQSWGRGRGGQPPTENKERREDEKLRSFTQRGRGRGNYKGTKPYVECYYCHKPGHKISDCWEKYPEKRRENGFVHEKGVENTETLLIASNGNIGDIWYLDSGATKHMTGNKNLFSTIVEANHGQVIIGDAKA